MLNKFWTHSVFFDIKEFEVTSSLKVLKLLWHHGLPGKLSMYMFLSFKVLVIIFAFHSGFHSTKSRTQEANEWSACTTCMKERKINNTRIFFLVDTCSHEEERIRVQHGTCSHEEDFTLFHKKKKFHKFGALIDNPKCLQSHKNSTHLNVTNLMF